MIFRIYRILFLTPKLDAAKKLFLTGLTGFTGLGIATEEKEGHRENILFFSVISLAQKAAGRSGFRFAPG
jgi:hypothetical protein